MTRETLNLDRPQKDDVRSSNRILLETAIKRRTAKIAVIGLGYVGMPAARAIAQAGFSVTGYDLDDERVRFVGANACPPPETGPGSLTVTSDSAGLDLAEVVLICVPTDKCGDGTVDLSAVRAAANEAAHRAAPTALFALESTVAPGSTRAVFDAALMDAGRDTIRDYVVHAPEREDPGRTDRTVGNIPRVLGADDDAARSVGCAFYSLISPEIVTTSTTDAAETAKVTENAFRAVNIAFANEVKATCQALGIDTREVIDAAASKPFGFMRFDPGPGVGGHCIPVDPGFMVQSARMAGAPLSVLAAAVDRNASEPAHVADRAFEGLHARRGGYVTAADVLVLGAAYKKNVADTRESPAKGIIARLFERGANVAYHDPYVSSIHIKDGGHVLMSEPLTETRLQQADLVIIVTDHDAIDWPFVAAEASMIADARGVFRETETTFTV